MTAEESLKLLQDGNKRFADGLRSVNTFMGNLNLKTLAEKGQNPHAIVVACSDSRIPTETIFDRGLGDLYVLRVAGNMVSDILLAGIEYASNFFSIPLCLVLGHTQCGAIKEAAGQIAHPEHELPSLNLEKLVNHIIPAVHDNAHPKSKDEEQIRSELTLSNVRRTVKRITQESEALKKSCDKGKLRIVGGIYNLETGKVDFDLT